MKIRSLKGKHRTLVKSYLSTRIGNRPRGLMLEGSVRSGKTVTQLIASLGVAAQLPSDSAIAIFAATRETATRNMVEPYLRPLLGSSLQERQHYLEFWGRKIWIIGCDNIKALNKIRGMTLGFAVLDEVSTFPKEVFGMIMTRLSEESAAWIGSTNPDSPYHWLYEDVLAPGKVCKSVKFTIRENEYLDPAYIEAVENDMRALGSVAYKRLIEGEWVVAEGQIWDVTDENMIDDSKWLSKYREDEEKEIVLGVDDGTVNPFGAVAISCSPERLVMLDEFYYQPGKDGRQLTELERAQKLVNWRKQNGYDPLTPWYIDPSAASLKGQMRLLGEVVHNQRNLRDVKKGLGAVSSLLGLNKLVLVRKTTPHTQKSMKNYVWKDPPRNSSNMQDYDEKPLKKNDHLCDASRYAVNSRTARKYWRHWLTDVSQEQLGATVNG